MRRGEVKLNITGERESVSLNLNPNLNLQLPEEIGIKSKIKIKRTNEPLSLTLSPLVPRGERELSGAKGSFNVPGRQARSTAKSEPPLPAHEPKPVLAVAQVSKPAVSPVSKPAAAGAVRCAGKEGAPADLEVGDTAGLETCATHRRLRLLPALISALRLGLFLAFLCLGFPAGAIVITRTSSPVFYLDTSIAPGLQGMYVSYQIYNDNGIVYPDLYVRIDSFSGGVISLAPGEDGLMHLGSLAPGQTKTAFFYLQAGSATTTPQSHVVHVYAAPPPAGELASASFSMTAEQTIQANANKVVTVVTGPTPPELGGIVTMTVTGNGGTVGASRILTFSPAAYLNWRPDAYQMIGSTITLSGGNSGTYTDQLMIIANTSAATDYTAVYTFRAINTTATPTLVSPTAYISSGTQMKHTTTGTYGTIPPIQPTENRFTLGKSVNPSQLLSAGTVTFTLTITNAGSYAANLDDFTDVLPATPGVMTYVAGSSRFNGAPLADPFISGSTLTWSGFITVPAASALALTFQARVPANLGSYTNRAVAHAGLAQIDTTLDTSDNAPAIAVVQVRSISVSGFVYLDVNRNLQKDPGEAGTGLALFAKLLSSSTPTGPALQIMPVAAGTGAYAFTNVQPGAYIIVIDNNNNPADVTPTLPSGWLGTEMPNQTRNPVVVGNGDVVNQNFGLVNGLTLTGRVFLDNGAGGGIANDGVVNGTEAGLPGVQVRLQDASGGTTYDTVTTDAAGNYALLIPVSLPAGAVLRVVESNPGGHLSTGASVGNSGGTYDRAADAITFTLALTSYSGLNFGDVLENSFLNDSQQAGLPGSFVLHSHTYLAQSAGQLSFQLSNLPSPALSGWNPVLYRDVNCNGQLESDEPVLLNQTLTVAAGERVCILIKDFIPVGAPFNAQNQITVTATFDYLGATPALTRILTRTALTIVGNPTTAGLTLTKSVNKDSARPGETITYTVTYANNSSDVLHQIVIYDNTPAFTTFVEAHAAALPANLTAVAITAPASGNAGPIQWTFTGTLAPGQSGSVAFTVTVSE